MHFGIGVGIPFVSRRNQFCSSLVNDNPHHPVVEEKSKVQAWIENKWWNWLLRNLTAVINQHITIIWVHCYPEMGNKQKSSLSEWVVLLCLLSKNPLCNLTSISTYRAMLSKGHSNLSSCSSTCMNSVPKEEGEYLAFHYFFLKKYYLEVVEMFFFWG